MKIESISSGSFSCVSSVDSEEKEIMRRLLAYGVTPTGNKITDKAKLREIELEKAKNSNIVLPDLLTVTRQEQEKIQKNKKDKRKEQLKDPKAETFEGSKALGEQIYLAIKMKKKKSEQKP